MASEGSASSRARERVAADSSFTEGAFREVLESVAMVAVALDVTGNVTFCNEYAARLLGRTREEVVGQSWFALTLPPAERAAIESSFLERIHAGRIAGIEQTAVFTKSGERRMITWNNTVLRNADGRVIGAAGIGSDITEEVRVKERVAHDALHDALTGLPNRVLFLDRLEQARARAAKREGGAFFAVLLLDLDRFKLVNDGLGHNVGDELLVAASAVIKRCIGEVDTVARLGGDEFAVLLENVAGVEDASRMARKISEALATPFHIGDADVFTTASIGIALGHDAYSRGEDVLRDANTAMYGAKAAGASKHVVFKGSMRMRAVKLLQTETDLRRALQRRELMLHYQPIVSLRSARIVGFEALVRWLHPRRGLVSPQEFVPIAEETGLILPIGRWVLAEACACVKEWEARRGSALDVSVNVNLSGRQFAQQDLLAEIDGVLGEAKIDPQNIKLEVTESVLMENADSARVTLESLRERGIRLCIDDFGTGYSSLAYLVRLPVDTIKVDRAFVRGMFERDENLEIVRTIVQLAKNLRMGIVAEGVETKEQRAKLEELGCEHGQGYLFAKPVDADTAWTMLTGGR